MGLEHIVNVISAAAGAMRIPLDKELSVSG